ncbi:MAG: hypothetical protein ACOX3W_04285 [Christensenellaceae bacterium]
MNKLRKLLQYEMKRIVVTKTYIFLSLLSIVLCLYVLNNIVVFGMYDTAPYSEWSFIYYLQWVLLFTAITLLPFTTKLYDKKETQVQIIMLATPTNVAKQKGIKVSAIFIIALCNLLVCVIAFFGYMLIKFKVLPSWSLLIYTALIGIPQLLLVLGLGVLVANINSKLPYILLAILIFVNVVAVSLPMEWDVLGNSILTIPQQQIPTVGVIAFYIPGKYILSRIGVGILGCCLLFLICKKKQKAL